MGAKLAGARHASTLVGNHLLAYRCHWLTTFPFSNQYSRISLAIPIFWPMHHLGTEFQRGQTYASAGNSPYWRGEWQRSATLIRASQHIAGCCLGYPRQRTYLVLQKVRIICHRYVNTDNILKMSYRYMLRNSVK